MAKQLNVKLNFQADTSQAQQALANLNTSLNQISNITPTVGTKLNSDLTSAKQSALELQKHLNNAFNAKTGNLDLSKLDASLKSSGQSLGTLSANLLKAGTSGQDAFLNIQRAIGNASVQINQASGALANFRTVLKNTARWQLSSSLLHGFIGGLQSAWSYAKDLDKSLNNIRIVTGYSSNEMVKFAEQANKAAKALSTTTTKYTDASLIFYQQGLNQEEVAKRTEVAIKMANVTGQSTKVVADQMTAVWNNFYDGTKSLEHYANVMTALGAATASSTDEIAGGLEKFAAIGKTIGLSYEYAAAALATITANTRQSEDVVGTALKTIFARIQGLNLGDTLDDGTTLNKYSQALAKVGISIFEQNGELKKMDNILDEMGNKWITLSKDQQTALAQTVAGVRQYNQLISLMENWNAGDRDSMTANLNTAYDSEGTLQKQQDIYTDSWQAAVDRVKASAEGIYKDLFPTEEMTGMMKAFEIILEGVDGLVEGFGGLQGILLLVSSIALNSFRNQIGGAIDDLIAKVGGGLTNAFTNMSQAFQTGGILSGLKAMFHYTGNVVTQTQRLSGELQTVASNSGNVTKQMELTEQAMKGGVSQALKMSMEMTQAAHGAKGMFVDDAFQKYNANLATINNVQASIEKSTRYLTKEQQKQLVVMQEQAQAANEQLLTAERLVNEAKRRKEAMLDSGGSQGSNLDRYVNIEKGKNAGKTAYTTDLINTGSYSKNKNVSTGNVGMVNQGLETYTKAVAMAVKQAQEVAKASNGTAEQIKKAGEEAQGTWNRAKVGLDSYKNHLAVVFDESINLVAVNKEVNTSYSDLITTSANVSDAISMWGTAAQGVPAAFNQLTAEQREAYAAAVELDGALDEALGNVSVPEELKTLTDDEKKAVLAAQELDKAIEAALDDLSGKGKLGAQLAAEIRDTAKSATTLQGKAEAVSKGLAGATEKMRTLGIATGSSEKDMENIKNGALETRERIAGTAQAADNLNNKLSQVVGTLQKSLEGAMSFGKTLSGAASGFSSIAMGISSIQNAFNTFNDEDASFTSKLTAGAMAATMGIRGMMAAMSGVSAVLGSVNAALSINKAATTAVAVASGEATKADLMNILTSKLKMTQEEAEAASKKLLMAAHKGDTAEVIKNTAANWANVASQAAKLWYITLIIAAIAALAVIIWKVVSAEDAETKALKAANEQLEASKNAYEQAKDAAASFKEEIANYQDAEQGLKSLEAGSKELAAAVEEANKKAKKLIETYGLFGKYTYGLNGEIIFNDGVLDGIQNQLDTIEKLTEIDYYGSLINQQNKQRDYNAKNIAEDDIFGQYTAYRKYTVAGSDYAAHREYGDYLTAEEAEAAIAANNRAANSYNPYDKGAGYQVHKITGNVTGKDIQTIQNAISSLEEVPTSAEGLISAIQDMEEETKGSSGLATYILNDIDSFINEQTFPTLMSFNDSVGEISEACKYYAEQIAGIMTDDDYAEGIARASGGDEGLAAVMNTAKNTLLNSEDGPDLGQITLDKQNALQTSVLDKTDDYDAATSQKGYVSSFVTDTLTGVEGFVDYDSWMEEHYDEIFAGSTKGYSSNLTTQDMGQAYLESQGYTITNVNNQNGKTTYSVMKDGVAMDDITYDNEIAQDLWAKQVGNYAIDQYVSNQATGALDPEKFEEMMTNIVKNGEQYGANFANAIVAGIANNGEFDFSSLFGEFSSAEIAEMKGMSGKDLAKKFLDITNEKDLKALGFDSWTDFEEGFKEGLYGWDPSIYRDAMNQKYEAIAEKADLDVDTFKAYRSQVAARKGFENDSEKDYANTWLNNLEATNVEEYTEAINYLAIVQARLSRGSKSLGENWKEWNEVLSDSDATVTEIAEIMPDLNEALADIMNWDIEDVELLPADFAQKYRQEIEDVYNGVDGAIEKLQGIATKSFIINLGIDTSEVQTEYQLIMQWLEDMPDYEIGVTLDSTGMTDAFNALLKAGLITVDQMNDILSKIGFTPEIKYKDVEITDSHTQSITSNGGFTRLDENGNEEWVPISNESEVSAHIGTSMRIPYIDGENTIYSGGGGVEIEAPKDRTGRKSKKPQRTHQSETVNRYKEVTDKIDDTTDAMEDARRAADGLWGPARIKKMREVQNEMRKEIGLLRQEKEEAESYLAQDQAYLESVGREFGVQFAFENGNIANYTAIMNSLHAQLRDAEIAAGSNPTDSQQKALDDIQYKISEVQKAIDIYDETREKIEDIDNEIEDKILELQQEKFDEINLELEVDLVVNETQLKEIEYYLNKIEDDFFGMAEAFALMVGENDRGFNQLGTYVDSLGDYQEQYNRLLFNYTTIDATTGRTLINQAQFIEGLQEVQDGLYENLGNLQDLNKEMMHYYGETLAAAAEELEKFTSLMDHHIEVLDYYSSLLELLGRSKEWKTIQNVLETQVSTAENAAKVSKANYDMLAEQAEQMKKAYDAGEVTEEQWLAAQNAANEAQNQMLENAEAWAEALKSLLENRLEELADILNKALSGDFGSLDNMISSMERSNSLQEEYLTTTNQIYETNKLMRTAQQEIDKTTNSVAKRRLKQFIDETNQMQNQNKLSQYELEIQQAKYDLLLAEIALEEAQQAKSTVRLQRDSEGNFGYVYTADQNQVAQAQQDLEDAQNSLYNIGLEGANKYAENYAQTLQEMNDAITELTRQWQEGEITSKEEYQRKMTELEEYYNKKLLQYSELRTIALSADSRVMTDAWSQDFADMTYKTQDWMSKVSEYVKDVERVMSDYQGNMDRVEEHVGLDIDSLEEKTSNLKDANTQLSGEIKDELIPSLRDEIDAVADLTKEYIKLYASIMETIGGYEDLATAIGKRIENESNSDDSNNLQPTGVGTSDSSGSSGNSGAGQVSVGGRIDAGSAEIHDFPGAPGERQYFRNDPTYTVLEEQGDWIKVRHHSLSSGVTGWFRKDQLAGYDTGGYTGNWEGSYGKLALLHKKELILNEGDTENFLAGMDVLNKIISTIDLYSLNAQLGGLLSTPSYGGFGDRDSIEQNVHIEASFPNVSDHNEIEEALSTLINRASQFASRK